MARKTTDLSVDRLTPPAVSQSARRTAASRPLDTHRANYVRRCLIACAGKDGYLRLVHSAQNLVQWLLRIAIIELGASATFWVSKLLLQGPSHLNGPSPATLHRWSAYIGLFGFLISELLYELQAILQRIEELRGSWRQGKSWRAQQRH
jgi:hypothetical protein